MNETETENQLLQKEKNRIAVEKNRFGFDATEYVKDKKCEDCGLTDEQHREKYSERLHIHHNKNNGRHNQRIGLDPESEDLSVLCRPCHARRDNLQHKDYAGERKHRMNEKLKSKYLELYQKYGEIRIKCQGANNLPIDAIFDFQGGLKKLSEANAVRLATSIFKEGFCSPFHVWENKGDSFCLDGHQRTFVLLGFREAGIPIPGLFPVSFVFADSEKEAREKLLVITSQYGEFQRDQLDDWLTGIDEEIRDILRLTEKEIPVLKINDPFDEYKGMPEFEQDDNMAFRSIIIHFDNQESINDFSVLVGQAITDKTKYLNFPHREKEILKDKRYISES